MLICELCGSANNELDDACRVCGLPLKTEAQASAPAPTNAAAQAATSSWPVPPHVATPPAPVQAPQPSPLQMSAVKQAPQTGVPPMMSDRQEIAPVAAAPDSTSVPGFMQSARTAPPQPEPVSLISANDLPDWIRQIAAEDEARAAAEAAAAPVPAEPVPSPAMVPPLGETQTAGPSTSWLSKSGTAPESASSWGAAETTPSGWSGHQQSGYSPHLPDQRAAVPPPAFAQAANDAFAYQHSTAVPPTSSRSAPAPASTPIYRKRHIQLLAAAILLLLLVAVVLA